MRRKTESEIQVRYRLFRTLKWYALTTLLVFGIGGSGTCLAAEDFPQKEITVVVNLAPGGGRDILSRGTARVWSKHLGVPMIALNMPGAGGCRGYEFLYKAAPDGYTIGVGGSTQIKDQLLGDYSFDLKKFAYIGNVQAAPLFIFVKGDSKFHSIKDFQTYGKPLRLATFSISAALTPLLLAESAGFKVDTVAGFKGTVACILSVLRGESEFFYAPLSPAWSYIKSGQIRAIVAIGDKRSSDLPDVPTIVEAGYGDLSVMSLSSWFMAPPGTPEGRLKILEKSLQNTVSDPEFIEWAKKTKVDLGPMGSEELKMSVLKSFTVFENYLPQMKKILVDNK